ncbi:MAG TPA: flippase-like domain-containing protein [Firmicutes bacterium]|nr:flippase-like domain-containing protein [Bacillota bacterium]
MKNLKKNIIFGISLSIGVIIVILIISIMKEGREVLLLKINMKSLLLTIIIVISLWFMDGLRLYTLLRFFKVKISLFKCIKINLISLFLASITPFGSGGMVGKIYLLSREGMTIGGGSAVVTIMYLINMLFFLLASTLFIIFFKESLPQNLWWNRIFYLLIASIALFSFLFFLFALKPKRLFNLTERIMKMRWAKRLSEEKRRKIIDGINKNIERYHRGITLLFKKKSLVPILILITFGYWFIFLNLSPSILNSLNVKFNYLRAVITQFIFHFFVTLAATPGGSGIAEAGYSSLFSSFVPPEKIFALTFLWRFFTYYIYLILGGIFSISEIKKLNLKDLTEPPRQRED